MRLVLCLCYHRGIVIVDERALMAGSSQVLCYNTFPPQAEARRIVKRLAQKLKYDYVDTDPRSIDYGGQHSAGEKLSFRRCFSTGGSHARRMLKRAKADLTGRHRSHHTAAALEGITARTELEIRRIVSSCWLLAFDQLAKVCCAADRCPPKIHSAHPHIIRRE